MATGISEKLISFFKSLLRSVGARKFQIEPPEHKTSIIFFPRGHVLTPLVEALEADDILLQPYLGLGDLLACVRRARSSNIIFYTPAWFLAAVPFLAKKHRYYYILHEPHLSRRRAGLCRFLAYEAWLGAMMIGTKFICASAAGHKIATNRKMIASKVVSDFVPLTLRDKIPVHHTKVCDFDVCMWGSINREKGLERFLAAAEKAPDLRFAILAASSERLRKIEWSSSEQANVKFCLIDGGFSDDALEEFIASSAILALPQHEATQSGQPPFALRAGLPIVATALPAFKDANGEEIAGIELVPNIDNLSAYADEMVLKIRNVLANQAALSSLARSSFVKHHAPEVAQRHLRMALGINGTHHQ